MGSFFFVLFQPLIEVCLQLVDGLVQFLPKRYPIELVEDGFVKPLTDPIGLGTLCLGARVVDILQG